MVQYIPTILVVCGIVASVLRASMPLVSMLPSKWQWLPGAVLSALGLLATGLAGVTDNVTAVTVIIGAIAAIVHGATQGHQDGAQEPPGSTASATGKVLPFLLVLLLIGCAGAKSPVDAKQLVCSDLGVTAIDKGCASLIDSVDAAERDVTLSACETLVLAQSKVCKSIWNGPEKVQATK